MKIKSIYILFLSVIALSSCSEDILNKKQDATIAAPSTIADYQYLLDGVEGGIINNAAGLYSFRSLGNYLSDESYATDANYTTYFSKKNLTKGALTWNNNLMFSDVTSLSEWDKQYKTILYANVALEGINSISPSNTEKSAWNTVKGMALFIRGQMYYNLSQFWAKPYSATTAANDQGIVLRNSSDADEVSTRSTVNATYNQIISDFKESLKYLSNTSSANTQISKVRPSKAAAYGALARTYLAMGDYNNVLAYSDSTLQLYSTLLDYNDLVDYGYIYALDNFNAETIHYSMDQGGAIGSEGGVWTVSDNLYSLYNDNDLRKSMFFMKNRRTGLLVWVGDYAAFSAFTGIAVDEMYLTRAEANARLGKTDAAMADLNALLVKRYKTDTFVNLTASTPADALNQILLERRKELANRGLRWTDIRRLNIPISRTVNGTVYTLSAGDSRYTLQIPAYVISASNGSIEQTK